MTPTTDEEVKGLIPERQRTNRQAAARGLSVVRGVGDRRADGLGLLVARLDDLNEIFRVQGEIIAAGRAAVAPLAAFLNRPPSVFPQPRIAAAECLAVLGGQAALEALLTAVACDHTAIGDPSSALAEEAVRNAAARGLVRFSDPRVVPALLAALSCHRLIGAGEALAKRGVPAAIPHLIDCLEDDAKRNPAMEALRLFGDAASAALVEGLAAPPAADAEPPGSVIRRSCAAELLGEFGTASAAVSLRRAAAEPRSRISIAATIALAEMGAGDVDARPLVAALSDADVATQAQAEWLLRRLGHEAVVVIRCAVIDGAVAIPWGDSQPVSAAVRRRLELAPSLR